MARHIPRIPSRPEGESKAVVALHAWIAATGESKSACARRLGTSRQLLSDWLGGKCLPSLRPATRIERVTGSVRVADWRVAA